MHNNYEKKNWLKEVGITGLPPSVFDPEEDGRIMQALGDPPSSLYRAEAPNEPGHQSIHRETPTPIDQKKASKSRWRAARGISPRRRSR